MPRPKPTFTPDPAQMALWPAVSGNALNGLGKEDVARPTPIYWHDPDRTPHGPLQRWFHAQSPNDPLLASARAARQQIIDAPLSPVAPDVVEMAAPAWSEKVKETGRRHGADLVGIAAVRPETSAAIRRRRAWLPGSTSKVIEPFRTAGRCC